MASTPAPRGAYEVVKEWSSRGRDGRKSEAEDTANGVVLELGGHLGDGTESLGGDGKASDGYSVHCLDAVDGSETV